MNIIGYINLYIRVDVERESEPSYVAWKSDFSKPVTEEVLKSLLDNIKETLIKTGIPAVTVSLVTREEFKQSKTVPLFSYKWNGEKKRKM